MSVQEITDDLVIIKKIENILEIKLEKITTDECRNIFSNKIGYSYDFENEIVIGLKIIGIDNPNLLNLVIELKNLTQLNLYNNQISNIPESIGELKNLTLLNLDNNQISNIPESIVELKNLTVLSLEGNNLISPPESTVKKGIKAIKSYFSSDFIKIYTCKMVIIGEGGVGKSCLLDSLLGKKFDKNKDSTHGMNEGKIIFTKSIDNQDMVLKVWDFGGQQIYHATHQFYLTNYSLFILVWNARAGYESGKIYKWLETVHALAPDSPILIVATHSKERGADLPKGDIESKYGKKVFFIEVDNENSKGIPELKSEIEDKAKNLKYMGIGRPKSWVKSKEELIKIEKKYIDEERLFDVFSKCKVDKNSYNSLARYLHELGDIIYYSDEEELKNTVIIKPSWVSQHIAKILDEDAISKDEGFLKKSLMNNIWSEIPFDTRMKFIMLMEKFDLSYRVPDSSETISLIVEKLKHEEHKEYKNKWENFEHNNEIILKYKLSTIPAGIPTWFIARTHRFSIYVHWLSGVVLMDNSKEHMALIIADKENKEIWLKVKGIQPVYFFGLLKDTLEFTFKRFIGLNYESFIPCKECGDFFKFKNLDKRKKPKIECHTCENDMSVNELLFGIKHSEDDINKKVDMLSKELKEHDNKSEKRLSELMKYIHIEFIKDYQTQQKYDDNTCPNIFTLKPIERNLIKKVVKKSKFELQLYCQYPECIHPIEEAKYEVELSKQWIMSMSKLYNKIVPFLRIALPVAAPGVVSYMKEIKLDDMSWMSDSTGRAGGMLGNIDVDDTELEEKEGLIKTEGNELHNLRKILEKCDHESVWGGLSKVITPEGYILWVCDEHKKKYD